MLPLSSPKKIHPKKTGIWAELERHLTVFITCQRHIGVLHTKEQVRVHNNICHLSTGIRVLGFPLYSERAFDFLSFSLFGVLWFSGYQHQTKATASSVTHSLHLISSLRLSPGWKFGSHFRARQELSQYRVAFAIVFFGLVVLFSLFFFFSFCLSPLRLTIRGTCSNALQPGKKDRDRNSGFLTPLLYLEFLGGIKGSFR